MDRLNNGKSGTIFTGFLILLLVFQSIVLFSVDNENAQMWVNSFGTQLIFALAVIVGVYVYRVDFIEISGIKRTLKVKQVLAVIGITALSFIAFLPLAYFFLKLLNILGYNYLPQYGDFVSTNWLFLLGIVGLAIFPAIGEELMFRVNMVNGFKGKGYGFAILMSALIFALMHGNASQLVHQFMIGAVMAYLFIITRTMWASVIFHFTNNMIALSISLIEARFNTQALDDFLSLESAGSIIGMSIMAIIGIILLIIMLKLFTKNCIKRKEQEESVPFLETAKVCVEKYQKSSKKIGTVKLGALGFIKTALVYLDRKNGAPIVIETQKDPITWGFWGGFGLILFIWIANIFMV